MTVVRLNPEMPKARRDLARWLREIADSIEADAAETEPNAALLVLAGAERFEVLWKGEDIDPGFTRGAITAARAVLCSGYETAGENLRPRSHQYGAPRGVAKVYELRVNRANEEG